MLNPLEKKILKRIAEAQLITRGELQKHLENNGSGSSAAAIDNATENMARMSLISTVRPIGSTCFVITKKGAQMLQEI